MLTGALALTVAPLMAHAMTAATVTRLSTSDTTPLVQGTVLIDSGDLLSVTIAGATYSESNGNLSIFVDGRWEVTIPTILADGVYDVTVSITDAAGNITTDPTEGELIINTNLDDSDGTDGAGGNPNQR